MKKLNVVLLLVNVYALVSRLIVLALKSQLIDWLLLSVLYTVMLVATVAGYYIWNTEELPEKEQHIYIFSIIFAVITGAII